MYDKTIRRLLADHVELGAEAERCDREADELRERIQQLQLRGDKARVAASEAYHAATALQEASRRDALGSMAATMGVRS